ncbi:hypothetical protein EJ08DRAFT_665732 [Tothia fuscella]|uniref:Uncharacterized protein n=1 Tax=Tothia fuscella TaxID=1048955 RepID=A0A9P4TTD1_9PEZI|nr:hypothetical protein EJ08DRAFT_665732 [Tothia fuscella]
MAHTSRDPHRRTPLDLTKPSRCLQAILNTLSLPWADIGEFQQLLHPEQTEHIKSLHFESDIPEPTFVPSNCYKTFTDVQKLQLHFTLRRTRNYTYDTMVKNFTTHGKLRQHDYKIIHLARLWPLVCGSISVTLEAGPNSDCTTQEFAKIKRYLQDEVFRPWTEDEPISLSLNLISKTLT